MPNPLHWPVENRGYMLKDELVCNQALAFRMIPALASLAGDDNAAFMNVQ